MIYFLNLFGTSEFEGFNVAVMAERMAFVMTDKHRLTQMAVAAIKLSWQSGMLH